MVVQTTSAKTMASADKRPMPASAQKLRDELEAVGRAISHDLQAPLRNILSGCEALGHHPAVNGDTSVRMAVQELGIEASHLKAMMQAMLDYVRLETFDTPLAPLDSSEVADTAIAMLAEEIRTTGATVTHDALPKVMGHRGRLTRLFGHLLENAIKFHAGRPPRVHISAERAGDMWEFHITDNGIGLKEEDADVIFRLFQRLHTAEEYPGIGAGLALSRKIVEAHGGSLRMKSGRKGEGSCFSFTLPAVTGNG